MKILCDFDGVMTDQTKEGHRELQIFRDALAEAGGASAVDALLTAAESELQANPKHHGWWSQGRLSAYAAEDLFIKVVAIAVCLDKWAEWETVEHHEAARTLLDALAKGEHKRFNSLAGWAYEQVVAETANGDMDPVDPAVAQSIPSLLKAGHKVVVVSNSSTDRVVALLSKAGLSPRAHEKDPTASLRVRGNAQKFELAGDSNWMKLGDVYFDVNRPHYRDLLAQEKPQLVIGDVFSLDLSLPVHLARNESSTFPKLRAVLRERSYTPAWARQLCASEDGVELISDFAQVVALTK